MSDGDPLRAAADYIDDARTCLKHGDLSIDLADGDHASEISDSLIEDIDGICSGLTDTLQELAIAADLHGDNNDD